MKTTKQVDIPMELYSKLLAYAQKNNLKSKSATQGEFVLAAIKKFTEEHFESKGKGESL